MVDLKYIRAVVTMTSYKAKSPNEMVAFYANLLNSTSKVKPRKVSKRVLRKKSQKVFKSLRDAPPLRAKRITTIIRRKRPTNSGVQRIICTTESRLTQYNSEAIRYFHIPDEGIDNVTEFIKSCKNLKVLDIKRCILDDDQCEVIIEALKECKHLKKVEVSRFAISDYSYELFDEQFVQLVIH